MAQAATVSSPPAASIKPVRRDDFWAIVLAGGEGVRLRPLVRRALGDERPKQYVPLLGERTLLGQTLDRIALGIPVDRTIVVTMDRHAEYIAQEFAGRAEPHILAQPADRGTAAAILYPACQISWRNPAATVAIFPSDHYIPGEATFMGYVAEVGVWLDRNPERLVLLGAQASSPETEYGWIEPGDQLGDLSTGPIRAVRQFREKPSVSQAKICLRSGHLWNTSVLIGKVATLMKAGRRAAPDICEALGRLKAVAGTEREVAAVRDAYERMPKASFSRAVLESHPEMLAVGRMPRLVWSDLGSPRRVIEILERTGTRPGWVGAISASA